MATSLEGSRRLETVLPQLQTKNIFHYVATGGREGMRTKRTLPVSSVRLITTTIAESDVYDMARSITVREKYE